MRPVEPAPPKRVVPPDEVRALDGDHAPQAPPEESAGEQAPALRSGAERRPMPRRPRHHPMPRPTRRDPPWRSRSRDPRRPHPAFLEEIPALSLGDRRRVAFDCRPPAGRSPGTSSPAALRFCQSRSPASTSCNHLSLAGPPSPSGEGRRSSWTGERLEAEAPGRPARSRRPLRSAAAPGRSREWVEASHEHPSSRAWSPSRRRPRWLVCETPRAPIPTPE